MVSCIEDGECSRAQGKHRRGIMLDIFHVTGILAGLIMLVGIGKFTQATPKKEKAETALESHAKMTKEFESQPGHKWTKKEKEQIAGLKKEYEDEKAEAESIEKKGWNCVLNAIFLGFLAFLQQLFVLDPTSVPWVLMMASVVSGILFTVLCLVESEKGDWDVKNEEAVKAPHSGAACQMFIFFGSIFALTQPAYPLPGWAWWALPILIVLSFVTCLFQCAVAAGMYDPYKYKKSAMEDTLVVDEAGEGYEDEEEYDEGDDEEDEDEEDE